MMSVRILARVRAAPTTCTCSTSHRLALSSGSSSRGPSHRPLSTSVVHLRQADDEWKPLTPPRPRPRHGASGLSPQKIYAQNRQRERVLNLNLDKPKWTNDPRERAPRKGPPSLRGRNGPPTGQRSADGFGSSVPAERILRSATAIGLSPNEVGSELEKQRQRSSRWKPKDAANDGPKFKGGGIGSKMVPGRVNHATRHTDKDKPLGGRPQAARANQERRRPKQAKVLKKVALPSALRLDNLCNILKMKLWHVQKAAQRLGLDDVRAERFLTAEDATLLSLELGFEPTIDDEAAFDLYSLPDLAPDDPLLSPRPPITGIFGHVDHGKTSLLDALRATSVAAGEAGGITQHIGAFEVEVDSMAENLRRKEKGLAPLAPNVSANGKKNKETGPTITFLDTPGHAAFTAMRSRGADVTDVVILVVAADDGVKPQTEEVIGLIKSADVGVVVAVTKCDKPGIDTTKVKQSLMSAGVEIEDFGGDVPCVEVSSLTGQGLPELLETVSAIAEVRELKAEREGRVEGRVIESRVEKGRGNVATVLVTRGCLKPSASLVAGTTWARVRTLIPPSGKAATSALPGQPVEVTGWKELPAAGDLVLEAKTEDEAKKAVQNRLRRKEQEKMWSDVEVINEKQRKDQEVLLKRREEEEKAKAKGLRGNAVIHAGDAAVEELQEGNDGVKELLLVIKADVSGTVEAVVGALENIGNKEAKVKILTSAVGDIQQGDVDMARAVGATIIGFNVKAPNSLIKDASRGPTPVPIHTSPIIYRLVDTVRKETAALLPKVIETRVHGEATVQQLFEISVKGKKETKKIAGSKVTNGVFQKARKARVVRNGETIFTGTVSTLKQVKKDVLEISKGVECGIALDDFDTFEPQDVIQSVEEIARDAEL
ncbi:hypothetical protein JCM3766R1_001052 [Sporobolomyces carnicolor]